MGFRSIIPEDPGSGRVLIVDDDTANRVLVLRILRRAGYECSMASSTEEARGLLSKSSFGVVVTDLRMYSEDGLELVRQIADRYPLTYAILVTGWFEEALEQQVQQAGGYAVVKKPVDTEDLITLVRGAFEEREKAVALHRHRSP